MKFLLFPAALLQIRNSAALVPIGLSLLLLVCGQAIAQNNALHFDGAGDYVSIPHDAALKPATHITVEAWIYVNSLPNTNNTYAEIARKEDGSSRMLFAFQREAGVTTLSFGLGVGGSYSELDVAITASDYVNRWVHVAAVYDGTQKIIYRNGVVIGTPQTVSGAIDASGTAPLFLGAENGGASFFNGTMDEFRFWNVARTQAQIQRGMTTELLGTESGLVVYYNFNEGVANANNTALSTVNDLATAVGGTNTGTLNGFTRNGTTSNWVGGNANNALNFDHTGSPNRDYVSVPYNSNLDITGALTLSAWVNISNTGADRNILLKGNYGYGFMIDGNNKVGYWSDPLYSNCPKFGTVTLGVWTHVAVVVMQNSSTTFYINGVQVGQSTTAGHTTINSGGASAVTTIGRQGNFDGNYFGGDMDEVMVWNTALTPTQVNTAMNMGFLGNESGLVAYYKFNQGVANGTNTGVTPLTDLAGGDNNGTLTNFTLSAGTVSNWVNGAIIAPEINVQGNATNITDGDATPSTADHTDFVATGISTPVVRTFTIQNQGSSILNISSISNTNTTDYTVSTAPTSIAAGASATFTVTLNSATLGTKTATITINNDDPNEAVYDFAITGRVINATPSTVRGNMMSFDGTNDLINAGNITQLNAASQVTFETWLYIPSGTWPSFAMIMSKQDGGSTSSFNRIELNLSGTGQGNQNDLIVVVGGPDANSNANYNTNTDVIQYNTWHHVSMVFDGTLTGDLNRLKLYVNGVQQGMTFSGSGSVPAQTPSTNAGAFCIGSRQGGTLPFRGSLEEARIWNTARTQAQIRENMHLTLSGAESGLMAYYQFNETSGNAIDAVAGNNGTLSGGATRTASTVSVGSGVSKTVSVTSLPLFAIDVDLSTTNMEIDFNGPPFGSSAHPNGDLVISQITGEKPYQNSTATNGTTSCYWIVRNFGTTNAGFEFASMRFLIPASNTILAVDETTPANLKLYHRAHNAGGAWTEAAVAGYALNSTKEILFNSPTNTSFSEFVIGLTDAPEINVQGGSPLTTITDGDVTPSPTDHTDFGTVGIMGTPVVRTFTIQNTGTNTLNITSVSNTNPAGYTVGTAPATIAAGGSATFTVTLNVATAGTKTATITLNSDDANEAAYDFALTGNVICPAATTLYTDANISTSGDGLSWATAYKTLSEALAFGQVCTGVTTINVATGTYTPTRKPFNAGVEITTADARDVTFQLRSGLALYGGYPAGGGTRNIAANPTILSGDIGTASVNTDNAYHVVLAAFANNTPTTRIDGFTITGGNANVNSSINVPQTINRNRGGAIYLNYGTNVFVNNQIIGNAASAYGAGLALEEGVNTINGNTFSGNTATGQGGGGAFLWGGTNTVSNNTFSGNSGNNGGAISTFTGTQTLLNNTLAGNTGTNQGGGIYFVSSTNILTNNIFWGNKKGTNAAVQSADFYNSGATNTFKNNVLQLANGSYTTAGSGLYDLGTAAADNLFATDPLFVDAADIDGADNIHRTADDGLRLQGTSPARNTGLNSAVAALPSDITGNSRTFDGTVDMGAYEQFDLSVFTAVTGSSQAVAADGQYTDVSGWTHYINDVQNKFILSVKKNGNDIGTIGDGTFSVTASTTADWSASTAAAITAPYATNTGWKAMNRWWKVTPTTQPTSDVQVRTYYTAADLDGLKTVTGDNTLTHSQLKFYKINGAGTDPNPALGHSGIDVASSYGANGYWEYNNNASASTTTWAAGSIGSDFSAEYTVASFSGGGGGGSQGGGNSNPLFPVEWLSFAATPNGNAVVLDWTTASEQNNAYFTAERSLNGVDFEAVGTIAAIGNSSTPVAYSLTDHALPAATTLHYRIRQTDMDGYSSHSEIRTVTLDRATGLVAWPNPATAQLTARIPEGVFTLVLTDEAGRVVRTVPTSGQATTISLDLSGLAAGGYILRAGAAAVRVVKE